VVKKTTINLWLNVLAFINFCALAATGAIMRWVLPPGSGGRFAGGGRGMGRGWRGGRGALDAAGSDEGPIKVLWGWGRHDWGDLHFWLAVGLIAIILLHLVLHWSWIRHNILPRRLGGR
jgi:hypothetical protein